MEMEEIWNIGVNTNQSKGKNGCTENYQIKYRNQTQQVVSEELRKVRSERMNKILGKWNTKINPETDRSGPLRQKRINKS